MRVVDHNFTVLQQRVPQTNKPVELVETDIKYSQTESNVFFPTYCR